MAIPEDLPSNKNFRLQLTAHFSCFRAPSLQLHCNSLFVSFRLNSSLSWFLNPPPPPFFLPCSLTLCSQLVLILKPKRSPLIFSLKLPFSFLYFSQAISNFSLLEPLFNLSCSLFKLFVSPLFLLSRKPLTAPLLQPSSSKASTTTMARWSRPRLRVPCN